MKVTSSDILAILRRFDVANDTHVPRHIEFIKSHRPSPINQLMSLRFDKFYYFILFDETAHDDSDYIMKQIHTVKSDATGELLENPTSDLTTFGLPFKGKDVYVFKVVSGKVRLDALLAQKYPQTSRSTWRKYIKAGYVTVNNQLVTVPKTEVVETDILRATIPERSSAEDQELPILYLDDHVIVINKPVGVLTHSKGAMNDEFTVADFFARYTTVGLDTNRPGVVHRLDRDTSGVMIGARTSEAFELLKRQFADRKAKKEYLALVTGTLEPARARIEIPIGRNPSVPSTFRADPSGKPATTDYELIDIANHMSYVRLMPRTGRTHQLRVHMAHLGHPIVGDRVYGTPADRLYLHAHSLEITIPHGERRTFVAELPESFQARLEQPS